MKPSEKILASTIRRGGDTNAAISAIIDYLDEQYEKNKTPEQRQRELDTIRSVQVPHIN